MQMYFTFNCNFIYSVLTWVHYWSFTIKKFKKTTICVQRDLSLCLKTLVCWSPLT